MNEIINIFENSMSLTVTTVIAAIGVGLNVWFKKKATGDPKREELIKSKFEIYKDMYLQIVLIKRSHCLNKSASEIDEIIKNLFNSFKKEEREKEKRNEFKVFSLDQLDNNNTALVDKVADDNNQYDTLNINEEVENVMNIINQLSKEDRDLITNLLIKNKTERELSTLMGVSQPAIHKRKKRIIENIKNKSKM